MVAATTTSAPAAAASPASPTAHSPLPTALSSLDQALLTRLYDDANSTLHDLFQSLAKDPIEGAPATLFALTQWAHQDHIKPWIDIRAAQHREDLQREMVALLKDIAKNSDNQVERRRAATTILRTLHGGPLLRGVRASLDSRGGGGRSGRGAPDEGLPARAAPLPRGTPRLTPSPSLPHRQLAATIAHAITQPDDPDSLATIKTFLAPDATIERQPATDIPAQIRKLKRRGHEPGQLVDLGPWDDHTNIFRYFSTYDGGPPRTQFHLERSPAGPHPNSWLITRIYHDSS